MIRKRRDLITSFPGRAWSWIGTDGNLRRPGAPTAKHSYEKSAEHRRFPRQSSPGHPRGAGRLLSLAIYALGGDHPADSPVSSRTLHPSVPPIRSLASN